MNFWIYMFLACLLLAVPIVVHGQSARPDISLLAVECDGNAGLCSREQLVRFDFRGGELIAKSIVLSPENNDVHFEFGTIYRNRYLITRSGDIVDIENKSLLHMSLGRYIATDGNRVIIKLNNADTIGYFAYDLVRKKYYRLRLPGKWALPGLPSPDRTKSVSGRNFEVWLHRLNGKMKSLGRRFLVEGDLSSSVTSIPPLLWLDNERVLTQKSNGEIVAIYLDGRVSPIVKIPINEPIFTQPYFFRDGKGQIVYNCNGRFFSIDVKNKRFASIQWLNLQAGFEAEVHFDESFGRYVRFRGKEIGRLWGLVFRSGTRNGHIAVEYGAPGSNLGYPDGVMVWSNANRKWTTLEMDWLVSVIGWFQD